MGRNAYRIFYFRLMTGEERMKRRCIPNNKSEYSTTETKLAALLLAEIPEATFEVSPNGNTFRRTIKVIYLDRYKGDVDRLIKEFIERRACAQVYKYNRSLNILRDAVR